MSIFIYEHALSKVTLVYKGKKVVEEFYQFTSSLSSEPHLKYFLNRECAPFPKAVGHQVLTTDIGDKSYLVNKSILIIFMSLLLDHSVC